MKLKHILRYISNMDIKESDKEKLSTDSKKLYKCIKKIESKEDAVIKTVSYVEKEEKKHKGQTSIT